ncbi:MAG: hypothetical protein COC12_04120 [Rhodobacteraceae bacterium]|nr:MAG: hypothetical protein COC12_04120 [Paracoccaceae bacterium]
MNDANVDPLPAPENLLDGADMRVQESIHGHRFIQEQEPFMLVLETLAICAAKPLGTIPPGDTTHEAFHYELPHRRKMRFLLFQDRHLEKVASDETIHDQAKWEEWKSRVNDQYDPTRDGQDHFSYLDHVFDRRIDALVQAVRLLRSMEVDVLHNRRWTSRFLAVTGPDMICTDMREGPNRSWSGDRRFFGRGGELIYLMLNRSSKAADVGKLIQKRLLNPDDPKNAIAKALCDQVDQKASSTHIGYLPYRHNAAYDRLADDWLAILNLDRLPNGHLFEPLFRITGLNLVVYLAERACTETGAKKVEPIVLDCTNGADKQLRQTSKEHLNRHRQAAHRAVQDYVENRAAKDEGWRTAIEQNDRVGAARAIQRLFGFRSNDTQLLSPDEQLKTLIQQAKTRDKNNIYKYLLPLVKNIGLATSRQRVGTWFGVDDAMIFALVMANVTRTVELREFVALLYDRYGLIIGPVEARKAFERPPVGVQSFEANLAAFESRMTRLSLTQRLSDDCAFVTNPYRNDHE